MIAMILLLLIVGKGKGECGWFWLNGVRGNVWGMSVKDFFWNGKGKGGWGKFACCGVMEWIKRLKDFMD
ncbi:hypothetical protein, partial [Bacillus pumilus]|uniref:hypothetical protein n=1 Tax=Bacillus pumilus TaxID=1408 RepID=UPI001C931A0D